MKPDVFRNPNLFQRDVCQLDISESFPRWSEMPGLVRCYNRIGELAGAIAIPAFVFRSVSGERCGFRDGREDPILVDTVRLIGTDQARAAELIPCQVLDTCGSGSTMPDLVCYVG